MASGDDRRVVKDNTNSEILNTDNNSNNMSESIVPDYDAQFSTFAPPRYVGARRLSTTSISYQIPANHHVAKHTVAEHGEQNWRSRTLAFLHSKPVELFLMGLLFLDVLFLFTEMFLLAEYPRCGLILRDGISCCAAEDPELQFRRQLAGYELCETEGLEAFLDYPAGCDEEKWIRVHRTEDILFSMTIVILSVFWIELNLVMVALNPGVFFRQFFFLIDYVVITISLIMEIIFRVYEEDILQSLVGLLVLVRVWRFVRIGHGIVELTYEAAQPEILYWQQYAQECEATLRCNAIDLPERPERKRIFADRNGTTH